jgi:hypothetical protein
MIESDSMSLRLEDICNICSRHLLLYALELDFVSSLDAPTCVVLTSKF